MRWGAAWAKRIAVRGLDDRVSSFHVCAHINYAHFEGELVRIELVFISASAEWSGLESSGCSGRLWGGDTWKMAMNHLRTRKHHASLPVYQKNSDPIPFAKPQ